MGAFGFEPWENDTAADLFSRIEKEPIVKIISDGLNGNYHEIIASSWLLSQLGVRYVYPMDTDHYRKANIKLRKIQKDEQWIESWTDPSVIKRSIDHLIDTVVDPYTIPPRKTSPHHHL